MDDDLVKWLLVLLANLALWGFAILIQHWKNSPSEWELPPEDESPPEGDRRPLPADPRPLDGLAAIPRRIHPTIWLSHRVRALAMPFLVMGHLIPVGIAGLVLAGWHIRSGTRWLGALRRGHYLRGRVVNRRRTFWQINRRAVVVYDIESVDHEGAWRTHRFWSHRSDMVDRDIVGLFFDPARPDAVAVEEDAGFVLSMDDTGQWATRWRYMALIVFATALPILLFEEAVLLPWLYVLGLAPDG